MSENASALHLVLTGDPALFAIVRLSLIVSLSAVLFAALIGAHPLDRADHYRKEAVKCHELAKHAQPAYLGDFYRRIAVRYMFMAEDVLNEARARGDVGPQRSSLGAAHSGIIPALI
jgi:hypothetical protein